MYCICKLAANMQLLSHELESRRVAEYMYIYFSAIHLILFLQELVVMLTSGSISRVEYIQSSVAPRQNNYFSSFDSFDLFYPYDIVNS